LTAKHTQFARQFLIKTVNKDIFAKVDKIRHYYIVEHKFVAEALSLHPKIKNNGQIKQKGFYQSVGDRKSCRFGLGAALAESPSRRGS